MYSYLYWTDCKEKGGQKLEILYQPEIVSSRRHKDNINLLRASFALLILSVSSILDESVFRDDDSTLQTCIPLGGY